MKTDPAPFPRPTRVGTPSGDRGRSPWAARRVRGLRHVGRALALVLLGLVAPARAQTYLGGALETDAAGGLRGRTLGTARGVLGDGVLFEAGTTTVGGRVRCSPTQPFDSPDPLPDGREGRLDRPQLVVPQSPGTWTSLHVLGLSGGSPVEATFDCASGLGATRPVSLPADWLLDGDAGSQRLLLDDGSILVVGRGSGSTLESSRYSAILRLVPGGGGGWTGAVLFDTRALRSLIEPDFLPTFDRNLHQSLRIDDFEVTPDGAVWMTVRQLDDRAVRGAWLLRWRPGPAWEGTELDFVHALVPGLRTELPLELDWLPELDVVMIAGRRFVSPTRATPDVLELPREVPTVLPSHDGRPWLTGSPASLARVMTPARAVPAIADLDSDTLTQTEEETLGSSDGALDSDGDGVLDVLERHTFATDPADAASRPEGVDVDDAPRFGVSTRIQTSAFASARAQATYESLWSSSPYLCANGACMTGEGEPLAGPGTDLAAFTADGSAWIGWSRSDTLIAFVDGSSLDRRVGALLAVTGTLGATFEGWVRPEGLFPYDLTLPDRASPHAGEALRTLLGVDDATGDAFVAVDDGRGQLVLRVGSSSGSGNAHTLFRPAWRSLPDLEALWWLDRHGVYLARVRRAVGARSEQWLFDRAMRPIERLDLPPLDFEVRRFFGRGYALVASGPEPFSGDFFTWFLAELVADTPGLRPGDVLAWGASEASGLFVYREDGTVVRSASPEALAALAVDTPTRERLAATSFDVVQMSIRSDTLEACLVDATGGLVVMTLASGSPTRVALVEAEGALGCAYDARDTLHWLTTEGLRLSVRTREGAEVAGGALASTARPRGLFATRDAAGEPVWIVDTLGASFDESADSACLRAGAEPMLTGFDAAGISISNARSGPEVVAWVDAVRDAYLPTDGTVRAALVDDFCAGRAAERAHSPEADNFFHVAYRTLLPSSMGTPDITVNEAAFALRPDGRFLFASRGLRSRASVAARPTGYLMQQAGAWLPADSGTPIAAHDPWRRSGPGALTLALPSVGIGAMAVVPGEVHEGWGRNAGFDHESPPSPVDAGVASDAGDGDGGTSPAEPTSSCSCHAPGAARSHGHVPGLLLVLGLALVHARRRT